MSTEKKKQEGVQEPLTYNLFGKPNSTVAMKPVNNEQLTVNNELRTETQPGAVAAPIQNVNAAQVAAPAKEQYVNSMQMKTQPNAYTQKLAEQQQAQQTQYVPDAENKGRGVANWMRRAFKPAQTEDGRRRQIQNISAITDVLRHAANLYYTSKGATPQNIQSQVQMNQAKWQAEDALKAEREKAAQEMALKQAKQKADEAYKAGQLGLGAERNAIAKGQLGIAMDKNARDAELHPYTMADKAAGVEAKKAQTERTRVETELAPKKFAEQQRHNRVSESQGQQRINVAWANHALSKMRLAGGGSGKSVGKKGDGSIDVYTTQNGIHYKISKDFKNNVEHVYDYMVKKGLIKQSDAVDVFGKPVPGKKRRPSQAEMLKLVVDVAETPQGHDDFVWWGKKLGYQYVDGMSKSVSDKVGGGIGYKGASI